MWSPTPSNVRLPTMALFRRHEPRKAISLAGFPSNSRRTLSGLSILQLGFSHQDGILLSEALQRLGARQVAVTEQVAPIGVERPGSLRYDGIVVNLDRFGDVDLGVDRLMRFRRARPGCFVVIASGGVAMDDFGDHRRAICDSTLRLPLTSSRIEQALEASLLNHRSRPV